MSEHTAKAFDSDLQDLSRMVAEMGGLAEKQVADAVDALAKRDTTLAQRVTADDVNIDNLQREIEEMAVLTQALYHARELAMTRMEEEADVLGVSERSTMADLLAETSVRWSDEDHPEGRPVRLVGLRYTDPGLEPRMERVYPTPWTRCDREADYRQAWAEFERRLGKKMPEGTLV